MNKIKHILNILSGLLNYLLLFNGVIVWLGLGIRHTIYVFTMLNLNLPILFAAIVGLTMTIGLSILFLKYVGERNNLEVDNN